MIKPFTLQLTTKVIWSSPAAEVVPKETAALKAARVLLVTDPGLASAGLAGEIESALCGSGLVTAVFSEVVGKVDPARRRHSQAIDL